MSNEQQPPPPLILDPALFSVINKLCNRALTYGNNHPDVRRVVNELYHTMRDRSLKVIGHDSPEASLISDLLRRTDPYLLERGEQRAAKPDPVALMFDKRQIDSDCVTAANTIRAIWRAWQRYTSVSARNYSGAGVKSSRAGHPVDVYGKELFRTYRLVFSPWYDKLRALKVNRKESGNVNASDIVFQVLIEGHVPDSTLDKAYRVPRNATLQVVKEALLSYVEHGKHNAP